MLRLGLFFTFLLVLFYNLLTKFKKRSLIMTGEGSTMVAIRLFKEEDINKTTEEVPVSSYMPVFISGDQADDNIRQRIQKYYLNGAPHIKKIYWNYRENPSVGGWIDNQG